jgi:hypothetical protein
MAHLVPDMIRIRVTGVSATPGRSADDKETKEQRAKRKAAYDRGTSAAAQSTGMGEADDVRILAGEFS